MEMCAVKLTRSCCVWIYKKRKNGFFTAVGTADPAAAGAEVAAELAAAEPAGKAVAGTVVADMAAVEDRTASEDTAAVPG